MKDHLGNNRIVADASGAVVQSTQYYPFGMAFAEQVGRSVQPYKYNGKELDEMNDLNQYDYSARFYDPAEIRFTTIDPLAENYYSWSPYVYCYNNPLRYIDPTGMSPEDDEKKEKEKESFLQSIYNAFNQMMEGVVYTIGFHPDQMNSENPAVREDARQKRANTQEALHTANETLLSIVPAGEVTYKKLNDREISASEYGWAAAEFIPIGKVGKLGKYAKLVNPGDLIRTERGISWTQSTEKVAEIMKTANTKGITDAVDVYQIGGKTYIIDGHHRVEAAKRLGQSVPVNYLSSPKGYNNIFDLQNAAYNANTGAFKIDGRYLNKILKP